MITTIDKAGRIVIPAPLRERLGLEAGTELELTLEDLSLRLTRKVAGPTVENVKGRLVVRPTVKQNELPDIDLARLIEDERDRWPL